MALIFLHVYLFLPLCSLGCLFLFSFVILLFLLYFLYIFYYSSHYVNKPTLLSYSSQIFLLLSRPSALSYHPTSIHSPYLILCGVKCQLVVVFIYGLTTSLCRPSGSVSYLLDRMFNCSCVYDSYKVCKSCTPIDSILNFFFSDQILLVHTVCSFKLVSGNFPDLIFTTTRVFTGIMQANNKSLILATVRSKLT